jgi:hypothetical protein
MMGLMLDSFWERVFVAAWQRIGIGRWADDTNRIGREIGYASEHVGFEYIAHCSILGNRTGVSTGAKWNMTRTAYIFMDFDGVTHPWGEVEDFRCLPHMEAVVREFPEARIVIASDWRMLFSMQKLMARFSEDVRPQIAGATPHLLPKTGAELHGLREREAMLWLGQHEANPAEVAWCAIDDAPGNWLSRSRLILTDFKRGFTIEDAHALRRMLLGFRAGLSKAPEPAATSLWARKLA